MYAKGSDSQWGWRGTQKCCEEVPGVPQNIEKHITAYNNRLFVSTSLLGMPKIVILRMVGCHQTFLVLHGALNPRRLKNTSLDCSIRTVIDNPKSKLDLDIQSHISDGVTAWVYIRHHRLRRRVKQFCDSYLGRPSIQPFFFFFFLKKCD
jgi:hypothetical protein